MNNDGNRPDHNGPAGGPTDKLGEPAGLAGIMARLRASESDEPGRDSRAGIAGTARPADVSIAPTILEQIVSDFDRIGAEVMAAVRADRTEAQRVIDNLMGRLEDEEGNGLNGTETQALVSALEVKSSMSLTAVKLLDAKTKLISTARVQIFNQNQQSSGPNVELQELLAQPEINDMD